MFLLYIKNQVNDGQIMIIFIAVFCISLFSTSQALSIEKIIESQKKWTLQDEYFSNCFDSGLEKLTGRNIALLLTRWDMVINNAKYYEETIHSFDQRANLFYPKINEFLNHPLNDVHIDTQILLRHALYNDNLYKIFSKAHKLGFEKNDIETLREIIFAIENPEISSIKRTMIKELFYATLSGNCKYIGKLIEGGAPINAVVSSNGTTALMMAIKNNFYYTAKIFLRHPNLNINAKEWHGYYSGMTALHHSIIIGNKKICKMILEHKKLNVDIQDDLGNSAIMLAVINDNSDLVELILNYHPTINLRLRNISGKRAIDLAKSQSIKKILKDHFNKQKYYDFF